MLDSDYIQDSYWLYNVPNVTTGVLSFSPNNTFFNATNVTEWLIEIGQVADQSFAGGNYIATDESSLYIGQGNYTSLLTGNENNTDSFT
jgi:hypothetical protein